MTPGMVMMVVGDRTLKRQGPVGCAQNLGELSKEEIEVILVGPFSSAEDMWL